MPTTTDVTTAIKSHLWLHESSQRDLYEHEMLRVFVNGEGCWLEDASGDRYFDLCSSMWQASLGHGREEIVEAYADQARRVASAGPIYFTTEGAAELAERLARVAPGDLSRCFLTSSGSEATEAAIKLARQYHRLRGDHHRFKFISRYGSYHGAGVGGTSVSGRRRRDRLYYPLMPGTVNVMPPTGTNDREAAEALRLVIEMEGPETIAAFFGEPVAITQFAIPDADYWPLVREICDDYGILLIADETLQGCCRTGRWWGIQHWDVVPDVMVVAKALSGGYAPVGGDGRPRARSTRRSTTTCRRRRSRATAGTARAPPPRRRRSRSTSRRGWTRPRSGWEPSSSGGWRGTATTSSCTTSAGSAPGSRSSCAIRPRASRSRQGLRGAWSVAPLAQPGAARRALLRRAPVGGDHAHRAAARRDRQRPRLRHGRRRHVLDRVAADRRS